MGFLGNFFNLIPTSLLQGLVLSFVVIGIMLPYRMLNFTDLTSEGSYPLGGCVTASLISVGVNPILSMLVAVLCGVLAGVTTAYIHLKLKINTLLAGILVMTMLFSIDLRILGRSNIALFTFDDFFKMLGGSLSETLTFKIAVVGSIVVVTLIALYYFFITEVGLAMRAIAASPDMAEAQGINISLMTMLGLGIANGLSAFGGAIMVQNQGFADVGMGFGILVNGLAALIIGESLLRSRRLIWQILAPLVGVVIYFQVLSLCLTAGLTPGDLRLFTGLFVLSMFLAVKGQNNDDRRT